MRGLLLCGVAVLVSCASDPIDGDTPPDPGALADLGDDKADGVGRTCDKRYVSRGCSVGHFPPGVLTNFGPALREPVGRLHWASTETATAWYGSIEGAVRSGERAADEVLAAE